MQAKAHQARAEKTQLLESAFAHRRFLAATGGRVEHRREPGAAQAVLGHQHVVEHRQAVEQAQILKAASDPAGSGDGVSRQRDDRVAAKRMSPLSGRYTPLIRSNSVVLPGDDREE
jgi:hypothetical protein